MAVRTVEAGRVRLKKRIRTENRTLDVGVMVDGAVVVERRAVAARPGREVGEGEFVVPVLAETVAAAARPRVYERVRAVVEEKTSTQRVETTVRKEELEERREPPGGSDAG